MTDPNTCQSLEVDRRDGLNAYFKCLNTTLQGFLHITLQRQRVPMANSEVWMLDVEIVEDFEGSPWVREYEVGRESIGSSSCSSDYYP